MKKKQIQDSRTREISRDKFPYATPKVVEFGRLTRVTQGSGGNGNDGGGVHTKKSDRGAKEKITLVGTNRLGLGLYLFDYRPEFQASCGSGRQLGYMADEVDTLYPEAVSIGKDGYKQVDYGQVARRLGGDGSQFFA